MNIWSHIAGWFLAPFLAFSGWFGMQAQVPPPDMTASTTPPAQVVTSTTTITTTSPQQPVKKPTPAPGPVACTMEAKQCADGSYVGRVGPSCQFAACPAPKSAVTIYSISPTSGPVGTIVSITGFGFTSSNIVHFGGGAIANLPITSSIAIACTTSPSCHGGINQTIQFTVPQSVGPYCAPGMACPMYMQLITPGTYNISVQNDNGTSNTISFTVTGENPFPPVPSNQAPSISGIDAPASLALGQSGTWTVHVTLAPGASTQLHYSVVWGDEANTASSNIMMPAPATIQTSATFTHAYERSGTYTPIFTVTNDAGQSSTVSSTITVTPLY